MQFTFKGIAAAAHTFAAYAEKAFAALRGDIPTIEHVAGTVLKYVGPILQMVVTAEAGAPAGQVTGKVLAEAQSDLLAAGSLIYDFGAHPSATSIIDSVSKNLDALLAAGHITNSNSVGMVKKAIGELDSLAIALPAPAATAPATVSA
jgi:hypothetical protein